MKRIVRLNERDLTRIVKRVIMEQDMMDDDLANEIEDMLKTADENDPGVLQRIIDEIEDAGHDVQMFIKKMRNKYGHGKLKRMIMRSITNHPLAKKIRYKRKKPVCPSKNSGTSCPDWD
jgi:hypothetical protein